MDPFLGEIRVVPFNFAPIGWAFCNGQILPISQNTALFALLGTTYGGNGVSNFALPNLQGCAPMSYGNGIGLSPYVLGETGGSQTETLILPQLPAHSHALMASTSDGNTQAPIGHALATVGRRELYDAPAAGTSLAPQSVSVAGGNEPHENMQPYLSLNFIIALVGVFPARS